MSSDKLAAAYQLHPRIYRDFLYVYPVISRRSHGLSIGINLNPDKICNFDCVYCQVDRKTPPKVTMFVLSTLERELHQMVELVQSGALACEYPFSTAMDMATRINDIAFSGDGEPTSVRQFDKIVETVVRVKQEYNLDSTKLVLITDAVGLDRHEVQIGLKLMDSNNGEVWTKLDAGTEQYFRQINRTAVPFHRILKNTLAAARQRPIVVQTMFLRLHGELPPTAEVEAYCDRLQEIVREGGRIKLIQAYTVARKPNDTAAAPLADEELDAVAGIVHKKTGLPVETFYGVSKA